MAWYPELKLGAVVLTNSHQSRISIRSPCVMNVLDNIIASNIPLYRQRFISATHATPAYPAEIKGDDLTNDALRNLIKSKALPEDAAALQRRSAYAGTYIISSWGFPGETFEIIEPNGELAWSYHGDVSQFT